MASSAELELDLPSLSFTADDLDDLGDVPAPSTPTVDGSNRSAALAVHWHDENSNVDVREDTKKGQEPLQPALPPLAVAPTTASSPPPAENATTPAVAASTAPPPPDAVSTAQLPPATSSSPMSTPTARLSPSASTAASSTTSAATHRSRPSIIGFGPGGSTLDLSVLNLSSPDEYLRMFRAVLTLQKKCRAWRVRIKERMKARVQDEKRRQEDEWQLKLHNIKQQRKHSQAMRQSQIALPTPPLPPLTEEATPTCPAPLPPPPAPPAMPPIPAPTAPAVWKVDLPEDEGHRLQFTLCMMKVQRLFRAKLARARLRLVEKLKLHKENQEQDMRDKIARRKRQRAQPAEAAAAVEPPLPPPVPTLSLPSPSSPPSLPPPSDEPLRGSLTSRARLSHLSRPDDPPSIPPRPRTAEAEVQVDADELREGEVLRSLSRQALYVPLRVGGREGGEGGGGVDVRVLADGHLRVMAGLAGLGVERRRGARKGGRWTGEGDALPFVTSASIMEPQCLSVGLYERMFGVRARGRWGGDGEEDEDWESIIHLPLPSAYSAARPMT